MAIIMMVLCKSCGNRFPNSILLDKAYKKEKEVCPNCNKNIFSYYNIEVEDEKTSNNLKNNSNKESDDYISAYSQADRYDSHQNEDDRYGDCLYKEDYSFRDEELLRHERETQAYILNDFNNNGINDDFE